MPRTLLDLAATRPIEQVDVALDEALRRRLVTLRYLEWFVERAAERGRPGIGALRKLIHSRRAGVPESVFETRLLRLLSRGGLAPPARQFHVRAHGRPIARVDFAYPDQKLAIEADGLMWHSTKADLERDARRQTALAALGWRVVRVTWSDLNQRPTEVLEQIRAAIEADVA